MSNKEAVEKDNIVELVDGEKINLTINGKTMEGLDLAGKDAPEFLENKIDYSQYEDLTQLFTAGLRQFAYFISLDIPEKFKKKTPKATDLHSSRNGIKAMKTCINLLEKQLKDGKTGYQKKDDYKYLHEWYVDGMIDFMHITMGEYPEDMNDPDDPDHAIKAAIAAFKDVRKQLLGYMKGEVNAV